METLQEYFINKSTKAQLLCLIHSNTHTPTLTHLHPHSPTCTHPPASTHRHTHTLIQDRTIGALVQFAFEAQKRERLVQQRDGALLRKHETDELAADGDRFDCERGDVTRRDETRWSDAEKMHGGSQQSLYSYWSNCAK